MDNNNPSSKAVVTVVVVIILAFVAYLVFGSMRDDAVMENTSAVEEVDNLATELDATANIDSSVELSEIDKEFGN